MNENREFRLDEISISSIALDLLHNFWVILVAMIAAALAVFGLQKLTYVPEYTVSSTLAVNATSDSSAYTSLSLTTQMADVFSEVFSSDVLNDLICEDLGLDSFDGTITATVIEETNLITVTVTCEDPQEAYRVMISALDNYNSVSDYLFTNAVLNTVQEPSVPYGPSNTVNIRRRMLQGMLLAGAAVAGLICVLSALRFTVKTRAGAKRNLDGKIMGTIGYERKINTLKEITKKKKKSLLISHTMVSMDFAENMRKAASRIERHLRHHDHKVLLVASVLENEGKSSVAANLALAMAEKGKNVILIDCDLKKPALYKIFDRPATNRKWLYEYLKGEADIKQVMNYSRKDHIYAIFQDQAVKNSSELLASDRLKQLIDLCKNSADAVILDSPPMMVSSDAELLMDQADSVVMVVRQDWSDVRAINDSVDRIHRTGKDFSGFILNAFRKDFSVGQIGTGIYGRYQKYYARRGGEGSGR